MIIPTILETDLKEILAKIELLKDEAALIQIDLVENTFVNGQTHLDLAYLNNLTVECDFELDFMVENPSRFVISAYPNVKKTCAYIKGKDLEGFLSLSQEKGYLSGLSLGPNDSISLLEKYMDIIDFVEFITVDPGAQGREFDTESLKKISEFKTKYPDVPLQVDGGIKEDNIFDLINLGVRDLVVGSGIFKTTDPMAQFKKFKEILKNAQSKE